MDADRVVEAVRHYVLDPSEPVQRRWDEPGSVTVQTRRFHYQIRPATWSIASEPWVADALRVLADSGRSDYLPTFGLLFARGADAIFLNDVAAMGELGSRLGEGLDPIAYAELLAELHYPLHQRDEPVVRPSSPGYLIRDPQKFLDQYPTLDATLPRPPTVRDDGGQRVIGFRSYVRYLLDYGSAIDVYDWRVTAPHGRPATWSHEAVAQRLELPVR